MADRYPLLDHIVILVSHQDLLAINKYTDGQFTLAPGGTHADGLTSNKLILLPDGVYLELIAFFDDVDPEKRRQHRWGKEKVNTIIDWAFTVPTDDDFKVFQQRLQNANTGVSYTDLIPGGRIKPDGTVLEWAVSVVKDSEGKGVQPGYYPFWCLDRTPRSRRVPYEEDTQLTQHPNGVQGVSSVIVQVPEQDSERLKNVYDKFLGGHGKFDVPSGSKASKHSVDAYSGGDFIIKLVFNGSKAGKGELLPGISYEIESV